jgi:hypothetical protein
MSYIEGLISASVSHPLSLQGFCILCWFLRYTNVPWKFVEAFCFTVDVVVTLNVGVSVCMG